MGKEIAVHMRLDPTMSNMLTGLDETCGEFADVRGNTVVRLEKVLLWRVFVDKIPPGFYKFNIWVFLPSFPSKQLRVFSSPF